MLTPKEMYWWLRGWTNRQKACGTKQQYSLKSARKAKIAMERKTQRTFDVYWCLFCHRFHIGGSVRRGARARLNGPHSK